MGKFKLKDRVRRIGQDEVRTVEEIREEPAAETLYWIQLGNDFATRVWAKESELEFANGRRTTIKVTALIKKEARVDPRTRNEFFEATLSLLDESGKEYSLPRYFSGYDAVGDLLKREAAITHQELQDRYPAYERGETVRLRLILENDEAIKYLGFDPKARRD